MGDVIPFFILAVVVAGAWLAIVALRGVKKPGVSPVAQADASKVEHWYRLLHDYDEILQKMGNDIEIKPFLPADMQTQIQKLHQRFRASL